MESYLNLDKNIYHQDLKIKKEDYLQISLNANNANNLNKASQVISFTLNPSNSPLLLSEAYLNFQITIEIIEATKKDITLEHNFFPNLFDNAVLKLGTEEVETILFPGETSNILSLVMFDNHENNGQLFGYVPDEIDGDTKDYGYLKRKKMYKNNSFYGMYPLKNMFGFLQYYNRVIYNMQGEIRFTRSVNNEKIFFGEEGSKAKLTINELQLFIPEIILNPVPELTLLQRIDDGKSVDVNFLTRFTSLLKLTTGTNNTIKPNNIAFKPIYIFVVFQNEVENSFQKNNSLFNQDKIKSLKVQVNNSFYPLNSIEIEKSKNHLFYLNYIKACKYFKNKPQISLLEFRELYSIFCFDVSSQSENLCINGADITLHITKDVNYVGNCIVIILAEKFMELKIKAGKMMTLEIKTEKNN